MGVALKRTLAKRGRKLLRAMAATARSPLDREVGVDWDDDKRTLDISDPYLRFYLRWQVRKGDSATTSVAEQLRLT